jgi:predicted metal-dependent peptidase
MVILARELRPDKIDLLYWDSAVAKHEEYDDSTYDDMHRTTKPGGGGGTDVRCVFDYIEKKDIEPECAIILTDGQTPWPKQPPSYPVLWVITTKGLTAPFGITVYMDPNA